MVMSQLVCPYLALQNLMWAAFGTVTVIMHQEQQPLGK